MHKSLGGRPLSSTSQRLSQRPSSALSRVNVIRPHTAPGVRASGVSRLTEERLRHQVVAECERLTATPEGSVVNQDISSAISDAGRAWTGSKELYLQLLNEDCES